MPIGCFTSCFPAALSLSRSTLSVIAIQQGALRSSCYFPINESVACCLLPSHIRPLRLARSFRRLCAPVCSLDCFHLVSTPLPRALRIFFRDQHRFHLFLSPVSGLHPYSHSGVSSFSSSESFSTLVNNPTVKLVPVGLQSSLINNVGMLFIAFLLCIFSLPPWF